MSRNILRHSAKFLRLLAKRRSAVPHEIQIEVTNRCNLDCDMCPRLTVLGVPEIDMAAATFETILERLVDPHSITLTGWGEPLMHPNLFDFADRIHERFPRCEVSFTTNGFLFSEGNVAAIAARRIERITVSLEELPWDEQGQERERAPGLDPKKGHQNSVARDGHPATSAVVTGLRRLFGERQKRRGAFPELRLQVVLFPDGESILLRLIDFAATEGFDIVNLVRLDVRGRPELKRPSWDEERRLIAAARRRGRERGIAVASVNDHGPLLRLAAHNDRFCMRLDDFIYIDVEGRVAPCCLLRNKSVGSLISEDLTTLWNGPELAKFYGAELPQDCAGCDAFLHHHAASARPETLHV